MDKLNVRSGRFDQRALQQHGEAKCEFWTFRPASVSHSHPMNLLVPFALFHLVHSAHQQLKSGLLLTSDRDVAQLVRASDRHAADADSIPRCGKGLFSHSQLSVQTLLRVYANPRVQLHALTSVRTMCRPCQSSVDYGNTKTPSMNSRLGSATLSQLAFPGEKQPEFPMGGIPVGQYSCKKKKSNSSKQIYNVTSGKLLDRA